MKPVNSSASADPAGNWNVKGTISLDRMRTFREHCCIRKDIPMLATALTLALLGLVMAVLVDLIQQNGAKITAALEGRSWTAQPLVLTRPMTVQFSPRYMAEQPTPMAPS